MTSTRHARSASLLLLLASFACAKRPPNASPPSDPAALESAGVSAYKAGRYVQAKADLEAARTVLERRGERSLLYARVLQDLAEVQRALGDPASAESLLGETLAIRQRLLPAGDPEIGRTLNNLGFVLCDRGRLPEAEASYRQSVAILEQALGPDHVDVAMPLGGLSLVVRRLHRCAEAETLGRRSLAIREKHLPAKHPDLGRGLAAVAQAVACDARRYPEAEKYYARSVDLWEESLGSRHPLVATALAEWASDAAAAGHADVAERLYARAVDIDATSLPAGHPATRAVRRRYEAIVQARHAATAENGAPAE